MENQIWKRIQNLQYKEGIAHMEKIWGRGKSGMLIGTTGVGKTFMVNRFAANKKITAFVVTASKSHRLFHILSELMAQMGWEAREIKAMKEKDRVDAIVDYLKVLKSEGKKPIIIIDESENLDISVLKTVKTFYDVLNNKCSILLIGTPELIEKLLNKMTRHRGGIPQLYRRLKVGTKVLPAINKHVEFQAFFTEHGVKEVSLQNLLLKHADNYGELHDFLEPLLLEMQETGEPLSAKMFKDYHGIM